MFVVLTHTTMFGVWFDLKVVGPFETIVAASAWLENCGYTELETGVWDREPASYEGEEDYQAVIEMVESIAESRMLR